MLLFSHKKTLLLQSDLTIFSICVIKFSFLQIKWLHELFYFSFSSKTYCCKVKWRSFTYCRNGFFPLQLFKRGASEAAAGCLASVAAKLVKTALENLFSILARGNKSTAANLGLFFLIFVRQLKSHIFQYTCAWK